MYKIIMNNLNFFGRHIYKYTPAESLIDEQEKPPVAVTNPRTLKNYTATKAI